MVIFLRYSLPRRKDGAYVINIDDKQSKETNWFSLFVGRNNVYFNPFGFEYIPQEVLIKIKDKFITHKIFTIQDDDSIMCGFYCIAFIQDLIPGKKLIDCTNLFSPNDYKKDDKITCKYFKDKYGKKNRKS